MHWRTLGRYHLTSSSSILPSPLRSLFLERHSNIGLVPVVVIMLAEVGGVAPVKPFWAMFT